MLNLEYHKGELCVLRPMLCQEGLCSGCIIYLEQSSQLNPSFSEENKQLVFKRNVYKKQLVKA
jgi:hypothetical protein